MKFALLLSIAMTAAVLLWFAVEGCFVVPNLIREWKKARRK